MSLKPELDIDCEFGKEQIDRFRANTVRDYSIGGPGIERGWEKLTDYTVKMKETPKKDGFSEFADKDPKRLTIKDNTTRVKNIIQISPNSYKDDFFNTNCDFVLYKDSNPPAKAKDQGLARESSDEKASSIVNSPILVNPVYEVPRKEETTLTEIRRLGSPALTKYKKKVINFERYNKKTKKGKKQKKEGNVQEPLIDLNNKNKIREELQRKYSYVPIVRIKVHPKFDEAFKSHRRCLRAEQIEQTHHCSPIQNSFTKISEEQQPFLMRKILNVRHRKIVIPRCIPNTVVPKTAEESPKNTVSSCSLINKPIEAIDRGQRLKNLLMDSKRLRSQEKLHHLVLPKDPLQDAQNKSLEIEQQIDFESARTYHTSTSGLSNPMGETPSSTNLSSLVTSSLPASPKAPSICTQYYDAQQPAKTFNSCMGVSEKPQLKVLYVRKGTELCGKKKFGLRCRVPKGLPKTMLSKRREQVKRTPADDLEVPNVKYIPLKGDFRSYFELDSVTLQILHWVSRMRFKNGQIEGQKRICNYLVHFYRKRLLYDGLFLHWFVNEGFFPAHYLLEKLPAEELKSFTNTQLDNDIIRYINRVNRPDQGQIRFTCQMAHLMVTSYFRVLYHRAISERRPSKERFLLRCRFAVSMVEHYQQERDRRLFKDRINYLKLMDWALQHESRVKQLFDEPISYAKERAGLENTVVMRTPNLHSLKEFYRRGVLPRPDALAINPMASSIRRYPDKERVRPLDFRCAIQGCLSGLNSQTLMAHFLTDHCRRIEELWLTDRMVLLFYPDSYPPMQIYCICVIALLDRMPRSLVPQPRIVLNEELPSKLLYFAGHIPCFLMFAQVSKKDIEEHAKRKLSHATIAGKDPLNPPDEKHATIYVFWLAIADFDYSNVGCRLYVYSQDHSIRGRSLLDFMKMSEFKSVPHMIINYPNSYLAIDYPTMVSLTKDFKEILFIEVRYVNKLVENSDDSGDETFDV
ncbi:uncharacterized protein LOC108149898 isoform X2 [Drosophila elegans]|uniref:uncharacterized protein LOC108149898 isoform X2 n=1 Tax=Drosophila elegans TaxID=30023 RepID=UPI001BC838D4|nr:uncharacterized protein LOC108149898 isoform X2 [Drosophila elegans]